MSVTNCAVMMGSVMLKSKSAPDSAMEDPATIALPRTVVTIALDDLDSSADFTTETTPETFGAEEDEHRTEQDRFTETTGQVRALGTEESLSVDIIVSELVGWRCR